LSSASETIFGRGLPLCEEFVYLSLAVEIEPERDRAYVAVGFSERPIGDRSIVRIRILP